MPRISKFLSAALTIAAILLLAVTWYWYATHTPLNPKAAKQQLTISQDSSGRQIADQLQHAHIISNSFAFYLYAVLHGRAGSLKSGVYQLSAAQTVAQIVDAISGGNQAEKRLTVPEGSTVQGIADLVASANIASKLDFTAAVQATSTPEGYLFPDTYYFLPGTKPEEVIQVMRANFDKKFTPALKQAAAAQGLSPDQAVILASIVEREANTPADRRLVAGIFEKRIREGIALQSDLVLQYALGGFDHVLTATDLASSSPYNLRIHKGLPPTAICSPGLDALTAVGQPTLSNYLFFIADKHGQMHYASTLAEHNANIAKYLK